MPIRTATMTFCSVRLQHDLISAYNNTYTGVIPCIWVMKMVLKNVADSPVIDFMPAWGRRHETIFHDAGPNLGLWGQFKWNKMRWIVFETSRAALTLQERVKKRKRKIRPRTEKVVNGTLFSLTLRHFRWHWGVQNTNYDIEINALYSVSVRC